MASESKPATIEEYIAAAPEAAQPNLRAIHACLAEVAPHTEQGIKWGSPTFTGRRIYFSFAAFRSFVNFYPTPRVIEAFRDRLAAYRTTDAGISFPHGEAPPLALLREIATYRVRDCEENDARWM
ncbi:iron chaperone [Pelagibacterium limicola]|uniref:iron chaperone n=1 Tax=Pelagibacterium limicola TaxID=2791022 RepID=UPI0018AFDDA0|nr:DUF1801 domain-containing protein [Pelagibacterium limicola]